MKGLVSGSHEVVRRYPFVYWMNLHTMIGAGGAEGALDASSILKPALAQEGNCS